MAARTSPVRITLIALVLVAVAAGAVYWFTMRAPKAPPAAAAPPPAEVGVATLVSADVPLAIALCRQGHRLPHRRDPLAGRRLPVEARVHRRRGGQGGRRAVPHRSARPTRRRSRGPRRRWRRPRRRSRRRKRISRASRASRRTRSRRQKALEDATAARDQSAAARSSRPRPTSRPPSSISNTR